MNYFKLKLPYFNQIFKDLEKFQPRITPCNTKCTSVHAITRSAQYLNFPDNVTDSIREEWTLFTYDIAVHEKLFELIETMWIDGYWRELFSSER